MTHEHKLPPGVTRTLVQRMLTFGVSVAIGLAPFLGAVDVPGFTSMLSLFPRYPIDLQKILIPLSSFLMGVTAVSAEYFDRDSISQRSLKKWFWAALATTLIAFVMLAGTHLFVIEHVGEQGVPVLVGFSEVPQCNECVGLGRAQCVKELSASYVDVERCFGGTQFKLSVFGLGALYLLVTCGFAGLVSSLVLRDRAKARRSIRKNSSPGARK